MDALLEFDEPLVSLTRPDIAFVAMYILELLRLAPRYFNGLLVVDKLDCFIKDFLARFGFCHKM